MNVTLRVDRVVRLAVDRRGDSVCAQFSQEHDVVAGQRQVIVANRQHHVLLRVLGRRSVIQFQVVTSDPDFPREVFITDDLTDPPAVPTEANVVFPFILFQRLAPGKYRPFLWEP